MAADFEMKLTADGKKFKKELEELTKLEVAVGYQDGVSYPDGTKVVDVALWNELGTVHIPSRPFIRDSLNNNKDKITQFMQKSAKGIVNGFSAEEVLKKIGENQVGLIQREILNGNFVQNSPETIKKKEKKGSDKPLIDTGLMCQSVKYVVHKKGGRSD